MKRPSRLAGTVVISMLAVLLSARCFSGEMTPLTPAHARLFDGRKLFIAIDGVVHVRIEPAPVVRLTDELLSLTFAFPTNKEEALEIALLPHTGAIVQSEKVLNDLASQLENAGLAKKSPHDQEPDIDSFTFRKDYRGMEFGANVTKRDDEGFTVGFVALVKRPEDRMQCLRVRRYSYNFEKDGLIRCYSEYDLLVGPYLEWQTGEGSPPPSVSHTKRRELATKMFEKCGKVLPPRR